MIPELPPALFLIAGSLLAIVLPQRARLTVVLAAPVAAMVVLIGLTPDSSLTYDVAGTTLILLKVDALRRLFGIIFILITFIGSIYALHNRNAGEHVAALFYAAGAVGVTFAGDWLTLFVF